MHCLNSKLRFFSPYAQEEPAENEYSPSAVEEHSAAAFLPFAFAEFAANEKAPSALPEQPEKLDAPPDVPPKDMLDSPAISLYASTSGIKVFIY